MNQIIECVPNFSEGRDMGIIKQITNEIDAIEGVKLLDVDPGKATNRTVVTFVGAPESVIEAAFLAVKKASEIIDMSKHTGEHPRFGATDVCPLIPIAGITMEETVEWARKLAKKIGDELKFPVYCYENAAFNDKRKNLATVRSGEYEGLAEKLKTSEWAPDFGPAVFVPRTGSLAVGARDFLVAYNVNLNTSSTRRANAIAFDVRERGRAKRRGNPLTGEIVTDKLGQTVMIPGSLKSVKAIGWFIEEYGIAQISMNLTNISITSIHKAFDEVCDKAGLRGIRVTGSEIVGLVPLDAILEAGRYFLRKQQRSLGVSDAELIKIAVKSMGLDELSPFDPNEKIIEYKMREGADKKLVNLTVKGFVEETASESPAPGGGSVSAYIGSLGISLATMVANLSAHKRGWDDKWEMYSNWAEKGKALQERLLNLVDEDTNAFNRIMAAFSLPKSTDDEKNNRKEAIYAATVNAIEVPLEVMRTSYAGYAIAKEMVDIGNQNSLSDVGVATIAIATCIEGAWMNILINSGEMQEDADVMQMIKEGKSLLDASVNQKEEIMKEVYKKLT